MVVPFQSEPLALELTDFDGKLEVVVQQGLEIDGRGRTLDQQTAVVEEREVVDLGERLFRGAVAARRQRHAQPVAERGHALADEAEQGGGEGVGLALLVLAPAVGHGEAVLFPRPIEERDEPVVEQVEPVAEGVALGAFGVAGKADQ